MPYPRFVVAQAPTGLAVSGSAPPLKRPDPAISIIDPDATTTYNRMVGVLKGDRVVNEIDVSALGPLSRSGSSTRFVRRSLRKRLGDRFTSQESPGASNTVNWQEFAFSVLAWGVIGGVMLALGYFCYRLITFVSGN